MHPYPKRASLGGLEVEIFKLVSFSATPEQWKEWLRVPLEHAAARGNLDLFKKLLEAGANGSAGWRGCRGRTLLDAAALGGNEDVVSGLLRTGSQPDVNVVSTTNGRSALYSATMLGHEAVGIRLVVAGADVNFEDPVDKRSVLHEAVRGGHDRLVTDLVIGGADLHNWDEYGNTPLHIAAKAGHDGIVSTLLLRGADKDALENVGKTPLMLASRAGHLCIVKTLLTAGADFKVRNDNEHSALDAAASRGHVPVLQAILGHGADVNDRDDQGFSALHVAAHPAVDALVEAGADVELKSNHGQTPLCNAANYANYDAMVALLQHGATVTARDSDINTPLHLACSGQTTGLAAAVDLLLRWGADETASNDEGKTPVEMLDVDHGDADYRASHDEVERTRLLLSRAPADRAWRRRGWLVMLRSRSEKERKAVMSCDSRGGTSDSPSAAGGPREGSGFKAARREGTGSGSDDHVVHRQASSGVGADGGDGHDEGRVGRGVVRLLLGLEPEGVFHTVLSFL